MPNMLSTANFYAARVREWNNKMVKNKEKELNMPPAPRNALS